MPTETVSFRSADGVVLEGRLATPESPAAGIAVVCHPHPQYGGSMSSGPIPAIWRALAAAGRATLRFNFRGVGRSEGAYDRGAGEVRDAAGAVAFMAERFGSSPAAIAGWSFGAIVALHAALADRAVDTYVALAPPVRMGSELDISHDPTVDELAAWHGRALGICGTEDPFCTPKALDAWAEQLPGMEVVVLEGEDHFFSGAHERVAQLVAGFVVR